MSILEVTFYEVQCDEPGCKVRTRELGGEFAAWADRDQAVVDWTDADFYSGPLGHFCDDHIPKCQGDGCSAQLWHGDSRLCEDCADKQDGAA